MGGEIMVALVIILIGMLIASLLFTYIIIKYAMTILRKCNIYRNRWELALTILEDYHHNIANELNTLHEQHPKTKWLEDLMVYVDNTYENTTFYCRLDPDKKQR